MKSSINIELKSSNIEEPLNGHLRSNAKNN